MARAVMDKLPGENVIYVGDTANTPYGSKSIAHVRELTLRVLDELALRGVKMIVIACNTATAAVLHDARERYEVAANISVIEVIRPAARRAVAATQTGKIGVIGTEATITSGAYRDALSIVPGLTVVQQACPRFVDFVERGITTGRELISVAEDYLAPIKDADIDTLILGCTHYPLLTGAISYVMGDEVTLVSSAEATADDVYRMLVSADAIREEPGAPTHEFFGTDDDNARFTELTRRFLGPVVTSVSRLEVSA